MGYTTDFTGQIRVKPKLSAAEIDYLTRFAESRRMLRRNGPYYIGAGDFGQDREADVIDYNAPPLGQPGLWDKWVPTPTGASIKWGGWEKFYDSPEWMLYLIQHFLAPGALAAGQVPGITGGHVLNGTIHAQGEDDNDTWDLVVEDNIVYTRRGRAQKERVLPAPYDFDLSYEQVKAYFEELFKTVPAINDKLFTRTHAVIDVDPDTGLPGNIIQIVDRHGPGHEAQRTSYRITPEGLIPITGTLEWNPPEE